MSMLLYAIKYKCEAFFYLFSLDILVKISSFGWSIFLWLKIFFVPCIASFNNQSLYIVFSMLKLHKTLQNKILVNVWRYDIALEVRGLPTWAILKNAIYCFSQCAFHIKMLQNQLILVFFVLSSISYLFLSSISYLFLSSNLLLFLSFSL